MAFLVSFYAILQPICKVNALPCSTRQIGSEGDVMIQSWGAGDDESVTWSVIIALQLVLPVSNPPSPVCAGTRPRVGGVSDRAAVDRANTVAENPRGSGLSRNRLAPDAPAGATGQDHRRAWLRTRSCRVE